ncbi:Cyanoglobin, putative [Perkinsus marinus ATCC 50983]|uniref:Group 1 truncated hemoglobin n=1 Tax=Perkinsus marinus (strain ATCC 50983 / TXsc) TaxID=423536 RepID=C5KVN8_PERM5|nr:Cyanoglobin, putative [Perkinsus marinus ATCC 50983]EER11423.1 Cyanoglobin, putative [Perkinsus marinus ATCC 50983]|eukprot:XP_002779628.1 Cyanoglobin, putative [Perkinsus marinus ATCC 50983]
MSTLYEKIGGEDAVNAAVELFYKKNLSDDRIKEVWAKTDMNKLKDHQRSFLTYVFGGSNNYTGRSMRAAHAGYNITDAQFDAVVENLTNTMKELGIPQEYVDQVNAIAKSEHDDVVGH